MERLATTQNGSERLHGHPRDVDERLLGGQRGTGSLAMKAQSARSVRLRAEALQHDCAPHAPCRAKLGDLFDEIVVHIEEKRQLSPQVIDVQPRVDRRLHVSDYGGPSEGELLCRILPCLAEAISVDRGRIPFPYRTR